MAKMAIGIVMVMMISIATSSFLTTAAAPRNFLQKDEFDMVDKQMPDQMVEDKENYGGINIENHHSCDIPCYNNRFNNPDGIKN